MKNRRNVLTNAGGGGPLLTGTIEQWKAYNCHAELRERAEAQSKNVRERFAIRHVSEPFEWRIRQRSRGLTCGSRASRRRRTALFLAFRGAVFRESSKTVSESVPRYEQVFNIGQIPN